MKDSLVSEVDTSGKLLTLFSFEGINKYQNLLVEIDKWLW